MPNRSSKAGHSSGVSGTMRVVIARPLRALSDSGAGRLEYHLRLFSLCSHRWRSLSTIPTHGFCRDCLTRAARRRDALPGAAAARGWSRHPELYRLHLAHIDCDAFYAAVEKRDNPELKDKPVIIGGGKRGVVSTACYIARIQGVRSAMPMFKALEACPEAVVIAPDMEKYVRVGREVRAMMQALTPLVEPLSIDEAFLDLAGTERLHGTPPALMLAALRARRREARSASPSRSGSPTASSSPRSPRT